MRLAIHSAILCFSFIGLALAGDADAVVRKPANIPPQQLVSALNAVSALRDIEVVYRPEVVGAVQTHGAVGEFDETELLRKILQGTGLTYQYIGDRTVTIVPAKNSSSRGGSVDRFRVAAATEGLADSSSDESDSLISKGIEEVMVTAQKRSERLQDVPMSMQAYSGKQLEQMRADSFRDYALTVPGLSVVDQGPGQQQITIRGLSSGTTVAAGDEPNNKETVGVYIDEVPVSANGFNPDLALFDVERVEVLRGPQGTLYGSGSMGGTVRTITKQPNLESFENSNRVLAGTTRFGGFNGAINSMVNLPLVADRFAVRAVGYYREEDGFVDNIALGEKNVNDARTSGGRIAAKWQAAEDLSILLKMLYQEVKLGGFQGSDQGLGDLQQFREVREPLRDRFTLTNAEINYTLPWGSIVSSTSYMDRDLVDRPDLTWLVRSLESVLGITAVPTVAINSTDSRTFVQETRLATDATRRLSAIVGAFYTKQTKSYGQSLPAPGFDALNDNAAADAGFPDNIFVSQLNFHERQIALFGDASLRVTDALTATVGLRWFDVTQKFDTSSFGFLAANLTGENKTEINDINPKFLLSYKASEDLLVYAQAAQGFRLGGANDLLPADVCAADLAAIGLTEGPSGFGNDTIWNYEIGVKSTWAERRLLVNAAAYRIDWSDVQTANALPCGFGFKENGGAAQVDGLELELAAFPAESLELRLGAAYTHTKLTKDVPSLSAESGDRLPGVPEVTAALTARYEVALCRSVECHLQLTAQYVGNSFNTFESNALVSEQPSYTLGSISFSVARERWNATAFVDNVTDERATLFVNQRLNDRITRNRPRSVGVQVNFNF